jgi:hypothetical protein
MIKDLKETLDLDLLLHWHPLRELIHLGYRLA